MTQPQAHRVELANMAAIIERMEGELALGEEPARFIAVLEGLGEDEVEAPLNE